MRILRLLAAGTLLLSLWGCQHKSDDDDTLKTTAPINNNAPGAQSAPSAPVNPSIMMPGGKGGKKPPPKSN